MQFDSSRLKLTGCLWGSPESAELISSDRFLSSRASVLAEVQTNRNSQLPTSKNILVLGASVKLRTLVFTD